MAVFKVRKDYLLLIAGIVWLIAGFNVARIGLQAAHGVWHIIWLVTAAAVFCLFFFLIFGRLVGKHTKRIMGFKDEKVWVFHFFDIKSYIIMAVMISGGIIVRSLNLMPDECIAMFYAGLGAALVAAGVAFIIQFVRVITGNLPELETAQGTTAQGSTPQNER